MAMSLLLTPLRRLEEAVFQGPVVQAAAVDLVLVPVEQVILLRCLRAKVIPVVIMLFLRHPDFHTSYPVRVAVLVHPVQRVNQMLIAR
jgi:hypothetical protein